MTTTIEGKVVWGKIRDISGNIEGTEIEGTLIFLRADPSDRPMQDCVYNLVASGKSWSEQDELRQFAGHQCKVTGQLTEVGYHIVFVVTTIEATDDTCEVRKEFKERRPFGALAASALESVKSLESARETTVLYLKSLATNDFLMAKQARVEVHVPIFDGCCDEACRKDCELYLEAEQLWLKLLSKRHEYSDAKRIQELHHSQHQSAVSMLVNKLPGTGENLGMFQYRPVSVTCKSSARLADGSYLTISVTAEGVFVYTNKAKRNLDEMASQHFQKSYQHLENPKVGTTNIKSDVEVVYKHGSHIAMSLHTTITKDR